MAEKMEPQRIIPAKNGGYLTPGNPGNRGGGPIPQAVREAALKGTADAIPVYLQIVNGGDDYTPLEKIAAGRELKDISGINRNLTLTISSDELIMRCVRWMFDHYRPIDCADDLVDFFSEAIGAIGEQFGQEP